MSREAFKISTGESWAHCYGCLRTHWGSEDEPLVCERCLAGFGSGESVWEKDTAYSRGMTTVVHPWEGEEEEEDDEEEEEGEEAAARTEIRLLLGPENPSQLHGSISFKTALPQDLYRWTIRWCRLCEREENRRLVVHAPNAVVATMVELLKLNHLRSVQLNALSVLHALSDTFDADVIVRVVR